MRWGRWVGARAVGPTKPVGQMVRHSRRVLRRTGHCTTTARQVFARHLNSSDEWGWKEVICGTSSYDYGTLRYVGAETRRVL